MDIKLKIKEQEVVIAKDRLVQFPYFEAMLNGMFMESEAEVLDLSSSLCDMDSFMEALRIVEDSDALKASMVTAKALDILFFIGYEIDPEKVKKCFSKSDVVNVYQYLYHYLRLSETAINLDRENLPWYEIERCRYEAGVVVINDFERTKVFRNNVDYRYYAYYVLPQCTQALFTINFVSNRDFGYKMTTKIVEEIGIYLDQQAKNNLLFLFLRNDLLLESMECLSIGADINFVYNGLDVVLLFIHCERKYRETFWNVI